MLATYNYTYSNTIAPKKRNSGIVKNDQTKTRSKHNKETKSQSSVPGL